MKLLLCVAAVGVVPDFKLADTTETPFKEVPNVRPNKDIIRTEIKRRDSSIKLPVRFSVAELMEV